MSALITSLLLVSAHQKVHFDQSTEKQHKTISLAPGESVDTSFYGLLSTGYNWMLHEQKPSDSKLVKLSVMRKQEVPPDNFAWNLTASNNITGVVDMVFYCAKPWESGDPAEVATLTINVGSSNITAAKDNECRPTNPGGCNVCSACCSPHIIDGNDCNTCVMMSCHRA